MKNLKRFLVLCFCFVILSSSFVYADETSEPIFYNVCRAENYNWYAAEGVFTAGVCQHGEKNDINSYTFYAFSKNNSSLQVKTERGSTSQSDKVDLGMSTVANTLKNSYGWSEEDASFLSSNFTYRVSDTIREDVDGDKKVYGYSSDAFLDYPNTNSKNLADVVNDLKGYFFDEDAWSDNGFDSNLGFLPLPTFNIQQALTMADNISSVKYTFNWSVSEHDIYANNPNRYKIQMVGSAKYTEKTSLGTTTVIAEDIGFINENCKTDISSGIPIYKESYSFLERTYRENLCKIANCNPYDSSVPTSYWFLFVRVIDPETEKVSLWKVYKCQGRNITSTGYCYDDKGNAFPTDSDDEFDYSGTFDSDPSTDDIEDPNSPSYNDGAELDAQHLLNNLEEIVSTLKGIPELFQKVFLWMPDYLIVLIATSIGLIVVVGFVKLFLH